MKTSMKHHFTFIKLKLTKSLTTVWIRKWRNKDLIEPTVAIKIAFIHAKYIVSMSAH